MEGQDYEQTTHSFIVKIWLEKAASARNPAIWRGYITHVTSDERRNIQSLNELSEFVARYLERVGARPSWQWRIKPLGRFWQRFCPAKR